MSFRNLDSQNEDLWDSIELNNVLSMIEKRTITPYFLRNIKKNDRVLEAGCGIGAWVKYLNDKGYTDVIGLDNNPNILERGNKYNLKLEYGDILNTDYEDKSIDKYISLGVIEHNEEGPQQALNEAYRILKCGGMAFISTPCNNLLRLLINHPIRDFINFLKKLSGKKLHFSEYRFWKSELVGHIKNAGFEIIEVIPNDVSLDQSDYTFGFYTDWPTFRHRTDKYRLNLIGKTIFSILKLISTSLVVSGYLVMAKKPDDC